MLITRLLKARGVRIIALHGVLIVLGNKRSVFHRRVSSRSLLNSDETCETSEHTKKTKKTVLKSEYHFRSGLGGANCAAILG
jgi:hypothetical protein